MRNFMILFVIGKDRPGIVDDVSTILFEQGANIEDSRMAAMGGCFSIMTLFSCPPESLAAIKAELSNLKNIGLETFLHQAQDPSVGPKQASLPLKLQILAMDHPGIVQKVVHILHHHNINIQSLNTQVIRAPLSGAPLFDLTLEADVPPEESIAKVKAELTDMAAELNLDLDFKK